MHGGGLVLRQHFFGADSDEVWKACTTVGELSNLLAMTYLQQENFPMTLELLKRPKFLQKEMSAGAQSLLITSHATTDARETAQRAHISSKGDEDRAAP